ncbi:MAG TPA: glycogen/starch/alpha-glucan phosphorylase [Clostridiaceae bacterium]
MNIEKTVLKTDFVKKLMNMFAEDVNDASKLHLYFALGSLVRDYVSAKWLCTNRQYTKKSSKQVYYFSIEFLIGRLLASNLLNLGIRDVCTEVLKDFGISLDELEEIEVDAGLGNGGLGRLAACFLDSLASLSLPGHGCGIRYKYGLFEQKIIDGYQVEIPDNWLRDGNVWEVRRENRAVEVKFGGYIRAQDIDGNIKFIHENYNSVLAVPYDTPVIGYDNNTVNTLRLWSAEIGEKDYNLSNLESDEYLKIVQHKRSIESISQVLYPDDSNREGMELRLKQQYFFVSAGVQSIIRTFKRSGNSLAYLDDFIAIHINDTHPAVAVGELLRILIDEEGFGWNEAWRITTNTIAYTNHTILSEALEKWPVDLFRGLLPRIYMIIEEINRRLCDSIFVKYGDWDKLKSMSIIENGYVRMAFLAIVGGHSVNGVAKIHTEILKRQELAEFYNFYPYKFNNKTNGITHRRWLMNANPTLSTLITSAIGDSWIKSPNDLKELNKFSKDSAFQDSLYNVKRDHKIAFSNMLFQKYDIRVNPNSIFDVQVKRLHAYKRQLLNVFHIMYLYNKLIENPTLDIVPRTFFFGAKAAPGYFLAKKIIKLINTLAAKINKDKRMKDKINVVFLENYKVSLAEKIIPSSEVSEQISTTTKEASGTGNMKFMMNGAITIATLDGANIEIRDEVGNDNIVIFGMNEKEVIDYYKNGGYSSRDLYTSDPRLNLVINQLINGFFNLSPSEFDVIYDSLIAHNDEYFVLKDFDSYVTAQARIDSLYRQKSKWQEMSIINVGSSGVFSSDNTILEYAKGIWDLKEEKIIL